MSNIDQNTAALISRLVNTSATLTETSDNAESLASGFEGAFVAFLDEFNAALAAGATETDIRKALQADQKGSGVKHIAASNAACSLIGSVAKVATLEGDLPETFVFRPDTNGAVGLREGERSLHALVRRITDIGGKSAVKSCIDASEGTKEGFVAQAVALVAADEKAKREEKRAEKGPKDAVKFLKAASGPVAKAADEETPLGDIADVEALIESLRASLSVVEVRIAAARTAAAAE